MLLLSFLATKKAVCRSNWKVTEGQFMFIEGLLILMTTLEGGGPCLRGGKSRLREVK